MTKKPSQSFDEARCREDDEGAQRALERQREKAARIAAERGANAAPVDNSKQEFNI